MKHILAVLYGLVFGVANIIPGVSGGTMLVVFGCYDKVCGALTLNLKEIKKNIIFLIFFGIGALGGIVGFSFVVTWLFASFPIQTNLFFMGLIIGSVPLILRNATVKDKFTPRCVLPFIAGLVAVVALTIAQNDSNAGEDFFMGVSEENGFSYVALTNMTDKTVSRWTIEKKDGGLDPIPAQQISSDKPQPSVSVGSSLTGKIKGLFTGEVKQDKLVIECECPPGSVTTFYYNDTGVFSAENCKISAEFTSAGMDIGLFAWLFIATLIAAVAMIIPGVSGSFVMVTLGTYSTAIGAIKSLDIITLIPIALGAVVGIVAGARLVTLLLKKYRLITFSVILGLVAGSIYAILPEGFGVNLATLAGVFALIAGAAISLIVGKKTKVES